MKTIAFKKAHSEDIGFHAKYCDTFFRKLIGLMFSKELPLDEGIILVEQTESRLNTSIHMLFMNYDITVLWLDKNMNIVDKALAKRWRPMYVPKKPAKYVIELNQACFSKFSIGDQLIFSDFSQ